MKHIRIGYHRPLNIRRGATRRTCEALLKSKRPYDQQESFIEACFYRRLDIDRTVAAFLPQPEPLTYEYDGVIRKAFSDVMLWRHDDSVAVREVKDAKAREDMALQTRFQFR